MYSLCFEIVLWTISLFAVIKCFPKIGQGVAAREPGKHLMCVLLLGVHCLFIIMLSLILDLTSIHGCKLEVRMNEIPLLMTMLY